MRLKTFAAAAVFLMTACAPVTQAPDVDPTLAKEEAEKQRQMVVDRYIAELRRLNAVAFRIFSANADLCREKEKSALGFGIKVGNAYSFPKELEAGARRVVGGSGRIRLVAVAPGSPAAAAGLRDDDAVISLDGISAPAGENEGATRDFVNLLAQQTRSGNPVRFRIRRDKAEMEFTVRPVEMCNYGYEVFADNIINAFADGKSVKIARGMMRFAETDEELATVVGHELAHNLMSHIEAKRGNAYIGLVFDIVAAGFGVNTQGLFSNIAGQSYSQEFETEADYVGLYLMSRAGYNIKNTPVFWRRMGVENPSSISTNHAASHPAPPHRYVSLEKTVEEIARKRAAGLPLMPELKKVE